MSNKETAYLDRKHILNAAAGLDPIRVQLEACSKFVSAAIGELDHAANPYTAESHRIVLKALAINLDAIGRLTDTLKNFGLKDGDVLLIDDAPVAHVGDASQITGLVEFAILRIGQLVNPMELHKLPVGKPGTPEFEEKYTPRVDTYKLVDMTIETLQKTHQILASDLHKFDTTEELRGQKFRSAKKSFLNQEIDRVKTDINDAKKFIEDSEVVLAKLVSELQNVDQVPLFQLPEGATTPPNSSAAGANPSTPADAESSAT